jgi:hypothetical protein
MKRRFRLGGQLAKGRRRKAVRPKRSNAAKEWPCRQNIFPGCRKSFFRRYSTSDAPMLIGRRSAFAIASDFINVIFASCDTPSGYPVLKCKKLFRLPLLCVSA